MIPGSVQAVKNMKTVVATIEQNRTKGKAGLISQVVGTIKMQKGTSIATVHPYIHAIPTY